MRKLSGLVAALTLAASFAAPCLATELITADGTSHTCEILKVNEDSVVARGKMKSGEVVELTVPAARLDPNCFYDLRDAAIGNDGKARLKLAVWAVEQGLFSRAKIQVRKAAEADPKLAEDIAAGKFPEIRESIATRILTSAEADIGAGRLDVARQKLEMLLGRLSDTAAGGKACDVIKTLGAKEAEADAKADADAKAKLDETAKKAVETRAKLLAPVDQDYAEGRAFAMEGLTEDDHTKALNLLEKGLAQGESAMKKIEAIEKGHADDTALLAEVAQRKQKTLKGMVKLHIHRADLYIWVLSLPDAKKELDAARALDPTNPEIDAALERVLAADEDDALELRYLRDRRQTGSRFGRGGGGGRGR